MHDKTPRPTCTRRIRKARSHFKTRSVKQYKTYSCITRRQDLQDAIERHTPISRRVQKTRQDLFEQNKTPRPTRRIRKARSHFKRRSEKQDKTYSCITRRQDLQDAFERHAPISRRIGKNKTRRIRAKQDAKTYKTHSNGTLPFQDAFRKQDKTYSCITRRQDLQDAFERHAPNSRCVQKNNTRRIRA